MSACRDIGKLSHNTHQRDKHLSRVPPPNRRLPPATQSPQPSFPRKHRHSRACGNPAVPQYGKCQLRQLAPRCYHPAKVQGRAERRGGIRKPTPPNCCHPPHPDETEIQQSPATRHDQQPTIADRIDNRPIEGWFLKSLTRAKSEPHDGRGTDDCLHQDRSNTGAGIRPLEFDSGPCFHFDSPSARIQLWIRHTTSTAALSRR